MKLIIAGGRDLSPSYGFIMSAIHMLNINDITEVVCGGVAGVDTEGQHWASHMHVPVKLFPADWKAHGKAGGPIRNKQMAEYADVLLLIWDGGSPGSLNMLREMRKLSKPTYQVVLQSSSLK